MTGQDTARAYLVLCAEWDWTPSPEGLDAWFRLWKGGYLDKWRDGCKSSEKQAPPPASS